MHTVTSDTLLLLAFATRRMFSAIGVANGSSFPPYRLELVGIAPEPAGDEVGELARLDRIEADECVPQVEDDGLVFHFLRSFLSCGHVRVFST